jgi:hypothetical protein
MAGRSEKLDSSVNSGREEEKMEATAGCDAIEEEEEEDEVEEGSRGQSGRGNREWSQGHGSSEGWSVVPGG